MSASFSSKVVRSIGYAIWVPAAFIGAQILTGFLFLAVAFFVPNLKTLDSAVYTTIFTAVSYALALLLVVGLPYLLQRKETPLTTLGLQRLLSWSDIGIGILAFLPYYLISGILLWVAILLFPVLSTSEAQVIPYDNLNQSYEYLAAFIALVVLAPFAEEALFRGYFQGKLMPIIGKWRAVLVVAAVFSLLHLVGERAGGGITLQWTVMIDILGLGLVLGALRIFTGSIWAGVLLHMFKNLLAFYFLFIYKG